MGNFSAEVLTSPIPVLVNFGAPWCGLCKMIQPILNRYEKEWQGEIKLVHVNADHNLKLANTYRITSLPTLILFEKGQVIQRIEGFANREDLYQILDRLSLTSV
jgi:thioredoxin 1